MSLMPDTISTWREYASNRSFKRLPNTGFTTTADTEDEFFERAICIEASTSKALKSKARNVWIIADVLILDQDICLDLQPWQSMFIYVRVISKLSNSAFNTTFASGQQSQLFIYCHQVDQVLTIGTQNQLMKTRLGEQGIAGIVLDSLPGTILEPKYEEFWPILEFSPSHFSNLIRTQLRIATLLYWTAPHIASSICYFITLATAQQSGASHIYMLATSIQQQILADSTTSNGVSYVPVLSSDHYRSSLIRAIDIANEYELGYKSLIKQNADLQNLEASLDIMLSQADANLAQQKLAADSAFTRWQNAEAVYSKARLTFSQRVISLRSRAVELESGIAQYRIKKGAELFLTILSTTITIAAAIGGLAAGMPTGMGAPNPNALIAPIADLEKYAKLQRDTVLWLFKYSEMMVKIYDLATKLVPVVKAAEKDPKAKLKLDEKYLSPQVIAVQAGDATALATIAAWDLWMIETDAQMEPAVNAGIDGAAKYRTELREHSVDGKFAAQAQAMVVKTSGEYVQAVLGLVAARESIGQMTKLRKSFTNQEDDILEARTVYFDRLEEARTNILIRMRTVQLAHQYETLTFSKTLLDPFKSSMLAYKEDAHAIVDELEQYQSLRADDPGPISFTRHASNLAPETGQQFHDYIVYSLMRPQIHEDPTLQPHSVTFTITPRTAATVESNLDTIADSSNPTLPSIPSKIFLPAISGPFVSGYYVRVYGMRAFLVGIIPSKTAIAKGEPTAVKLQISTSGLYSDVDAEGKVSTFSTQPISRGFQYLINKDGSIRGKVDGDFEIDSIQENKNHINPTAFTQWTVKITNPQDLYLDGLTDVEFYWRGVQYS